MTIKPQLGNDIERVEGLRLPPPMADGDDHLERLGRFVDNLLGSAHRLAEADGASSGRSAVRRIQRLVDSSETPDEPPPIEIPEPLPDGDDPFTRVKIRQE